MTRRLTPRRWIAIGASAVAFVLAGRVSAQTTDAVRSSSPAAAFDVGIVTEVPIMIGGQATLELPYGFLLQAEAGAMPSAYADAVDAVAVAAGANAQLVAPLLHAGLDGAFVGGVSAGMRPFPRLGLEILGGYTLIALGGTADASQAVDAATGLMLPAGSAAVTLHSTLHNVHVSLGWRWLIGSHVVVRASAGYLQTVASSSHVEAPALAAMDPNAAVDLAAANSTIDRELDGIYRQYVKSPVVSLSLSYRF